MKIELTDQQEQAVKNGHPVEVRDPATAQAFVLLPREQYERVRPLLEGRREQSPPAPVPPPRSPDADKTPRIRLRNLPTPPEVAEETKRLCREYGWGREEVEEQLKLKYYYGGQAIYVLRSADGPVIVPIEERYKDTPDLRYVLLTADERSRACHTVPSPWHDTVAQIPSS